MPATSARIGFVTEQYRLATAGPVASVANAYGNAARDTEEPIETFFDRQQDAQVLADERLRLLSKPRQLFSVTANDTEQAFCIDLSRRLPAAHLIDEELERDSVHLIAGMQINMGDERSTFEAWG